MRVSPALAGITSKLKLSTSRYEKYELVTEFKETKRTVDVYGGGGKCLDPVGQEAVTLLGLLLPLSGASLIVHRSIIACCSPAAHEIQRSRSRFTILLQHPR